MKMTMADLTENEFNVMGEQLDLNADGTYSYNQAFVLEMAGVRIGFAVLAFILGVFSAKRTAKAGRGFGYERRKEEYKKIQSFSFANLDQFRINSLITRRTNDIQLISDSFCQSLRPFLRGPFQLLNERHLRIAVVCIAGQNFV